MIQKRNVAVAILLSILTCGLYSIYWMIKMNNEINTVGDTTQDTSGIAVVLLTLITCGIYGWFWMYKCGEKLDTIATRKGLPPQSRGVICLVLALFGFSIVSYALLQDSLNKVIE